MNEEKKKADVVAAAVLETAEMTQKQKAIKVAANPVAYKAQAMATHPELSGNNGAINTKWIWTIGNVRHEIRKTPKAQQLPLELSDNGVPIFAVLAIHQGNIERAEIAAQREFIKLRQLLEPRDDGTGPSLSLIHI